MLLIDTHVHLDAEQFDADRAEVLARARQSGVEQMVCPALSAASSRAVVRLADGEWHGVVAYRILDSAEHQGAEPAPQTGCYVEEVASDGPVMPPWRFE